MNPEPYPGVGLGWVSSHPKKSQNGILWMVGAGSLKPLGCSSPGREQKIFRLSPDDIYAQQCSANE